MRRGLVAATAVLTVTLAGTVATGAPGYARPNSPSGAPHHASFGPGAAGIGDSYFPDYGNGGYDVAHYRLRLRYEPGTDQLTGTATLLATATQGLTSFNLDFLLDVSSVTVNGRPATFSRSGAHELVVRPAHPLLPHQRMVVTIQYSGTPSTRQVNGYTAWTRTADGALAVNEPESAWWWFPSNDHPLDKATYDVSVSVPAGVEAISNGVQVGPPVAEAGNRVRWNWRSSTPTATYLAFIAVGQYDLVTGTAPNGQPVVNAYHTGLGEYDAPARASIARTAEVVAWASTVFGPYPFEAQGGVVAPAGSLHFALETQTRPVYDALFWRRGVNPYVVVHENAHQWFGDSVSVADWQHIWLNEGFASYAEWLWSEREGEGTAQEVFDYVYGSYPADDPFWQVLPGAPGAARIFDDAVYDRGAMMVHQLRLAVGDEAFFRIVPAWTAAHRYGNGTTEQLRQLAEQISGRDLSALFTTWLFTAGRPAVTGTTASRTTAAPAAPRSWARIQEGHRLLAH